MVWAIREYEEIDPIILSVDEDDEVSIKQVADAIAETLNYTGPVKVRKSRLALRHITHNFPVRHVQG